MDAVIIECTCAAKPEKNGKNGKRDVKSYGSRRKRAEKLEGEKRKNVIDGMGEKR